MSELAWSKAARLLSLDRAAGWPLLLDLRRLAELQAGKETKEQRDEARDIEATLLRACKAGTLPCEAHESPTRTRYAVVHRPAFPVAGGWADELGHGFGDVRVKVGPTPRPQPALKATIYRLSPATFATWLAGEGLTPSHLVAAWFKATGATASTPPAELAPSATQAVPEPLRVASATREKTGRNDAIKPLISKAQQQAANPEDAAEVFNILREWALQPKPHPPLKGGLSKDGKGLLWENSLGDTAALSRDALDQRLRRMRTPTASRARPLMSKLQRIK